MRSTKVETLTKVETAVSRIRNNENMLQVLKELHLSKGSYYYYKKRFEGTPSITVHQSLKEVPQKRGPKPFKQQSSKCVVIIADLSTLPQLLRSLS